MDNQRFLLWASFGLVLFLIYQAWVQDYQAVAPAQQVAASPDLTPAPQGGATAVADSGSDPDADLMPSLEAVPAGPQDAGPISPEADNKDMAGQQIRVVTDVLDMRIDTLGGALVYAAMKRYPVAKKRPNDPVVLLNTGPDYFVVQTGLRAAAGAAEPTHRAQWRADKTDFRLADGSDEVAVLLRWSAEGMSATRTYRFRRGSYRIEIETRIRNEGEAAWRGADYLQMIRQNRQLKRSFASVDAYSFLGPAVFDGERYDKLDAGDLEEGPWRVSVKGGWLALIQHHFLVADVPQPELVYQLEATLLDSGRFLLRSVGPTRDIAPGASESFMQTVFVGPKLHDQLEAIGEKLPLTVDYGFTTIIAQPLFWVLNKIHSVVGNWGWSIILLTLLIKLVFYKLAETSGRSMAKMRKLQPRMKALQERYKDDRQKLSQSMMELYKQEKANPAAGCLPLLVQMPVFFALYWVLIESVELRQAPWALWINDLSSRDPYFVLPVLMGISMFAMQKLNPQPTDPIQAKVMLAMPLMMGAFMAFFPSGLVLYWLVNNLLSIAQQWRINKVVEAER